MKVSNAGKIWLELMARGAMRIGEILKLYPRDISERKILLRSLKAVVSRK